MKHLDSTREWLKTKPKFKTAIFFLVPKEDLESNPNLVREMQTYLEYHPERFIVVERVGEWSDTSSLHSSDSEVI